MAGIADMRRYRATSRVTPEQRHAAMRAVAQWALTQPDPEAALAELLGALGLAPGHVLYGGGKQ